MTSLLPLAALWDFDGTLVDSASNWFRAEAAVVAALGGPAWPQEESARIHGFSMIDGAKTLIEWCGRTGEADPEWAIGLMEDDVRASMSGAVLQWQPGALELAAEVASHGLPQAIVSATSVSILEDAIASLDPNPFATVVGGDSVNWGKPHPEPYLTAAARLGVPARACVAFEDSREGRAAAEAAGCFVVAINFNYPHSSAPGRMPVDTLEALGWGGVVEEFGRWAAAR